MPSERMFGGKTTMLGGQTSSITGKLQKNKIANTVARYPTRLLVLMNRISFPSAPISAVAVNGEVQ